MKSRTVLLLAGAVAALSTAAVAMAASGGSQAESKAATSGSAKVDHPLSEAEKRAARRAANEQRLKDQDHAPAKSSPREEEEEEARKQ